MKTLKNSEVTNVRNKFLILKTNELLQIRGGKKPTYETVTTKESEID